MTRMRCRPRSRAKERVMPSERPCRSLTDRLSSGLYPPHGCKPGGAHHSHEAGQVNHENRHRTISKEARGGDSGRRQERSPRERARSGRPDAHRAGYDGGAGGAGAGLLRRADGPRHPKFSDQRPAVSAGIPARPRPHQMGGGRRQSVPGFAGQETRGGHPGRQPGGDQGTMGPGVPGRHLPDRVRDVDEYERQRGDRQPGLRADGRVARQQDRAPE